MGSRIGILKVAAQRTRHTLEEYSAKVARNLKWCTRCKRWRPTREFDRDRSRGDGLKASCRSCCYVRTSPGPTKAERRKQRASGAAWCRGCERWMPLRNVYSGLCRSCANASARARYATNVAVRAARRQHAHSRKRGVAPIAAAVQMALLAEFNHSCAYCGAVATTWDHLIPVGRGGSSVADNVVPACVSCNSSKKARDIRAWLKAKGLAPSERLLARLAKLR